MNYDKEDKYIEKFYRRNILKREKSEIERVVIVNILKVLLTTTENPKDPGRDEPLKEFIPESNFLYKN